MPIETTVAVIIAAGRSRRMGSPKPLMRWQGRAALDHLAERFGACGARILVLRAGSEWWPGPWAHVYEAVLNPEPERGMLSSIQCGLTAALERGAAALLCPVDCLGFAPATPAALVRAGDAARRSVIPEHEGRPGHPVFLRHEQLPALLRLDPRHSSLAEGLAQLSPPPLQLALDDPGILRNINTPAELVEAAREEE